jgi:choline dehydrogenase
MDFDYIVIGSGSAGSSLTARLLEKGMKVLLVEAGKRERIPVTRPARRADPHRRQSAL